jgi:hypothetical protein
VQGRVRSSVDSRDSQALVDIESFSRKSLITRTIDHSMLVNLSS